MQVLETMSTINELTAWKPSKILVPTDLSRVSDRAIVYAAALAGHYHAHLYLAHVMTATKDSRVSNEVVAGDPNDRENAEHKIAAIMNSGVLDGVRHTVLLEEGYFWQTVDALLRKFAVDLAVAATHGWKDPAAQFQGSWAELVFRHAECPVITLGPGCDQPSGSGPVVKKILFASDFGRAAAHAIPYACSLAREFGAQLTMLHAVEEGCRYSSPEWPITQETARIQLLESLPEGAEQSFSPEYVVRCGDSAQEILSAARSHETDLIVMGARLGQKLVTHLPESTAYTVAAEAPCPVLTIKAY